jgi:FMN phosphatase YigB (HAD superfamily)
MQAINVSLPWDVIFSGELLESYKLYVHVMENFSRSGFHVSSRNPKMYLGAAKHLRVSPSKVAMVAAHVEDLRAAARCGLKTIYVSRSFEWSRGEEKIIEDETRVNEEFDAVVKSFLELVEVVRR